MTSNIHHTGALHRLLKLVLEASAVAVAIHYAAPWEQDAPPVPGAEKRQDATCRSYEMNYLAA
ncbi:MAG: hypothetical protein ABWZ75_09730 [Novosphingobium sp.]